MKKLDHPNIINFHEFYRSDTHYYVVSELVRGGELFDKIIEKEYYTEKEARDLAKDLFSAMEYCHSLNIAHRDLKPENILLESEDDDSNVKIADFGFAQDQGIMTTACGTPNYVARKYNILYI